MLSNLARDIRRNQFNRSMKDYVLSLLPNVPQTVNTEGNYYHVQQASDAVQLSFGQNAKVTRYQTQGGEQDYNEVEIVSGVPQTVIISLGFGTVTDSRATLSGAGLSVDIGGNTSINRLGSIAIPADTEVLIAAANVNRKELRINIPDSESGGVDIGSAGMNSSARGGYLIEGSTEYLQGSYALHAYNPNAFVVNINLLEFIG
jgi:hypothetical protein